MVESTPKQQPNKVGKPIIKEKPQFLRSPPVSPISPMEPDFLKDDLLGEHEDEPLPPPIRTKSESIPIANSSSNITPNRLVIAIDYGTTFTGNDMLRRFDA